MQRVLGDGEGEVDYGRPELDLWAESHAYEKNVMAEAGKGAFEVLLIG